MRLLRESCPHLQYDPHPKAKWHGGKWCEGGSRVTLDDHAAVELVVDRLGVDLTTAAVLVRDLLPVLLVREDT